MSRTRKAEYTGSKRFDRTCRNHGSCDYCRENRLIQSRKRLEAYRDSLKEFKDDRDDYETFLDYELALPESQYWNEYDEWRLRD
jgi:hypothetical protein